MSAEGTYVIAVDGPAASGKSTLARALAARLGCACVNSGNLYRSVAWGILQRGIDPRDVEAVSEAVRGMTIGTHWEGSELAVTVDGRDPGNGVREPAVAAAVSGVAGVPAVREILTARLRSLADDRSLVMEGRDIGTEVFPGTPWKFYINASEEERVRRRRAQGEEDSIASRDRQDSRRATAPLRVADDAVVIDSTALTPDQVLGEVIANLQGRGFPV